MKWIYNKIVPVHMKNVVYAAMMKALEVTYVFVVGYPGIRTIGKCCMDYGSAHFDSNAIMSYVVPNRFPMSAKGAVDA